MKSTVTTFRKFAALFVAIFGCIFLNFQYAMAYDDFTLCEGFSYQNLPKDYEIPASDIKAFEKNEYIRREDLKLLTIKYIDFSGNVKNGKLVTAYQATNPKTNETVDLSKEVLEIFKELFDAKYPIDTFSCFYFRNIAETNKLSWHSHGLAIDINYKRNPCVTTDQKTGKVTAIIPENSEKYIDRSLHEKGMIKKNDACYNAFVNRGWEWGGSWTVPVDYMHFQKFPWYYPTPKPKYKVPKSGVIS